MKVLLTLLVDTVSLGMAAEGPYRAEWSSISNHRIPDWFHDAKFGIYAHWGPLTMATKDVNSGWYGRKMYQGDGSTAGTNAKLDDKPTKDFLYHRERWGDQKEVGYKDIIPEFQPVNFNAEEWADVFARSGAKFAGPVAVHHDNFMMWDSDVSRWNIKKTFGVDITGELGKAIRKRGMKFLMTFHHSYSWWYYSPAFKYDAAIPGNEDLYGPPHAFSEDSDSFATYPDAEFEDRWYRLLEESCLKYNPDLVWFDFALGFMSDEIRRKAYARMFNIAKENGKDLGLCYKERDIIPIPRKAGILDFERGRADKMLELPWLTDTSTGAWFYSEKRKSRKAGELVDILVDIVAKNGSMPLNIGPKPDGSLPKDHVKVLLEIGDWLKVNGEGIYRTRPWAVAGEGPTVLGGKGHFAEKKRLVYTNKDIRFTRAKGGRTLYLFVLDRPKEPVVSRSLATINPHLTQGIQSVTLLGFKEKIDWRHGEDGLHLSFPKNAEGDHAWCYHIRLSPGAEEKSETLSQRERQKLIQE